MSTHLRLPQQQVAMAVEAVSFTRVCEQLPAGRLNQMLLTHEPSEMPQQQHACRAWASIDHLLLCFKPEMLHVMKLILQARHCILMLLDGCLVHVHFTCQSLELLLSVPQLSLQMLPPIRVSALILILAFWTHHHRPF